MSDLQEVSQTAQALADETRLRVLLTLLEGKATVNEIAARTGIPQPRVSTHLSVLRRAGLISAEAQGRHRTYSADVPRVSTLLSALQKGGEAGQSSPPRSVQAQRLVRQNSLLRQSRTCYDHLAGVAGVSLLDAMLASGWLEAEPTGEDGRTRYHITALGEHALAERQVDVGRARHSRRLFAYGCLDWTERRHHLGGALGAAVLDALRRDGLVERQPGSRAVALSRPLEEWTGISPGQAAPAVVQ